MVGRYVMGFIHPADIEKITASLNEMLINPHIVVNNISRMRHRDGRWVWVEAVGKNSLADPDVRAIVINFRY